MGEFRMPSLGADMESGVLLEWLVEPGTQVHRGDIVALVDTDKAEIEIEAFEDGVIDDLVPAGDRFPVGTRLATITGDASGPEASSPATARPAELAPESEPQMTPEPVSMPQVAAVPTPQAAPEPEPEPQVAPEPVLPEAVPLHPRPRVSPLARRAAADRHVDLVGLAGTGFDHAITLADVERVAAGRQPAGEPQHQAAPAPLATEPPPRDAARARHPAGDAMREATAALMARSKREIPHFSVESTIDLAAAMAWIGRHNADRPASERILPAAVLLAATAHAAHQVPALNGRFVDGRPELASAVHLGVALALRGGGLVAPALLDADRATAPELMVRLRDLAERTKGGVLRASEMTEATLTVTNLGERGAERVLGVIYPPQLAIVGFGGIRDRVLAVDGMVAVRPSVIATVAADHRACDGHSASRFLAALDQFLQTPEHLA